MNLNKNLRTEQFDIDVCVEVAEFYRAWFDALWDEAGRKQDNRAIIKAVYDRFAAGVEGETRSQDAPRRAQGGRAPRLQDMAFSPEDLRGLID